MRKQTKIVAVASAAALLAIGASMTSFAAIGWVEEDGQWYYYDSDGVRVEDAWKKSGDNWYWLDSEEGGAMAVDKLIEDDDNHYYVDSNGAMVRNTWVKVVNEDQDDDDDPAEYNYYYMQSTGRAYKANDSGETKFKTIDGKRYAFDEDGKMLYGWLNEDATRASDESDWEQATYYCGAWDDGAMKTGWQKIAVYDQDEDDDFEYWFNFKSNGQKRVLEGDDLKKTTVLEKKINGKKYGFDDRGVMVYEWTLTTDNDLASASTYSWKYFSNPEDGARKTKGWFKVIAPIDEDNSFRDYDATFAKSHADDESEKWYYADGEGNLYEGEIKKIKGKYYGFRPDDGNKGGSMLVGLCALKVLPDGTIDTVYAEDMDSDDLDDCIDGVGDFKGLTDFDLYYFGSGDDADTDGAMRTGSTTINLDGESYQFMFSKTGGAEGKGRGLTGIDSEKYVYKYGKKMKADSDDKYMVVYANADTGSGEAEVYEIETVDLRKEYTDCGANKDGDTVKAVLKDDVVGKVVDSADLTFINGANSWGDQIYLLNTSGSIIKNKTAAKDGNDWYFYVEDKNIVMYTNNKTLKGDTDESGKNTMTVDLNNWKEWN